MTKTDRRTYLAALMVLTAIICLMAWGMRKPPALPAESKFAGYVCRIGNPDGKESFSVMVDSRPLICYDK